MPENEKSEIGYCGNEQCSVIQQPKVECTDPKCPKRDRGKHSHCRKCGELL